jgi:hypothetical protein
MCGRDKKRMTILKVKARRRMTKRARSQALAVSPRTKRKCQ